MSRIAFQGEPGANSQIACNQCQPQMEPLPCTTFDEALAQLRSGAAALAMMPVENSAAGRVADLHRLLPDSGLHIIGEHFMQVAHCLLAPSGVREADLSHVRSHEMALGQCRRLITELGLGMVVTADTAGAARQLAEDAMPGHAAIASELAAQIYGLQVLRRGIEDDSRNTTRFLIMATGEQRPPPDSPCITSFVFRVRNVPAALYKSLGGFATNGVNMTKLESYQSQGFLATRFYADIEGHPDNPPVALALEELAFYCTELRILGVYPAAPARRPQSPA